MTSLEKSDERKCFLPHVAHEINIFAMTVCLCVSGGVEGPVGVEGTKLPLLQRFFTVL